MSGGWPFSDVLLGLCPENLCPGPVGRPSRHNTQLGIACTLVAGRCEFVALAVYRTHVAAAECKFRCTLGALLVWVRLLGTQACWCA